MNKLLVEIVSKLEHSRICRNIQVLETNYFSIEQYAFKLRASLSSSFTLQIRIYHNKDHFDYSYQLFSDSPICRWDNAEHFPQIKTFPHHFHSPQDKVVESPLKGDPVNDLQLVVFEVEKLLPKLSDS